jgi:hypothetical protein
MVENQKTDTLDRTYCLSYHVCTSIGFWERDYSLAERYKLNKTKDIAFKRFWLFGGLNVRSSEGCAFTQQTSCCSGKACQVAKLLNLLSRVVFRGLTVVKIS